MIHLLAAVQAFDTGGFTVSITDVRNNAALVEPHAGGGGVHISVPLHRFGTFEPAFFGGLDGEGERYQVGEVVVSVASVTGEVEVGGRFRFGDPDLMGVVEFGGGMHVRGAIAGENVAEVRPMYGTHTLIGAEFGPEKLRTVVGLRGALSFGNGWYGPDRHKQTGDVLVDWDWQPNDLRVQLCAGVGLP
ncbi:hypothetical protein LBMAG42_33790 [Deltaproteobacteria bacterium]|nr:hypothetical protein LBMAG42_33790 [Deltaproteobacteria bacterium]